MNDMSWFEQRMRIMRDTMVGEAHKHCMPLRAEARKLETKIRNGNATNKERKRLVAIEGHFQCLDRIADSLYKLMAETIP